MHPTKIKNPPVTTMDLPGLLLILSLIAKPRHKQQYALKQVTAAMQNVILPKTKEKPAPTTIMIALNVTPKPKPGPLKYESDGSYDIDKYFGSKQSFIIQAKRTISYA